jgi:hypothetical protein
MIDTLRAAFLLYNNGHEPDDSQGLYTCMNSVGRFLRNRIGPAPTINIFAELKPLFPTGKGYLVFIQDEIPDGNVDVAYWRTSRASHETTSMEPARRSGPASSSVTRLGDDAHQANDECQTPIQPKGTSRLTFPATMGRASQNYSTIVLNPVPVYTIASLVALKESFR